LIAAASRVAYTALVALLVAAPCYAAQEESTHVGDLDVVIWTPSVEAHQPLPVVVFSHGLYTCATQSRFIMRAIADAGYFVVAPNHEDATCAFSVGGLGLSRLPGKPWSLWTDADYRDRADDIRKLVAALPNDRRFATRIDLHRLALSGHSLGGYTVLGLAGAWTSWTLPDVKAVLAFAPYTMPFRREGGIRHLAAPVMYQSGGFDPAFTRPLKGAFADSPSPKYYIEIEHAWHLAWTDIGRMHRDEIVAPAIAFLDMYVKSAAPAHRTAQASAHQDLPVTP
jgi:predicted dienelactone hydrolase